MTEAEKLVKILQTYTEIPEVLHDDFSDVGFAEDGKWVWDWEAINDLTIGEIEEIIDILMDEIGAIDEN